jgi:isopentenyldiphosphate isomerase
MVRVMKPRPSVFVGSSSEGLDIALNIQVILDEECEVTVWSQGVFGLSTGTLESLVLALDQFDFAILVLTPDDMTVTRSVERQTARDNVLFELGLFMGALGRLRTFIVYDRTAKLALPSDLAGVCAADYAPHTSGNLRAALGAPTTNILQAIRKLGFRERSRRVEQGTHEIQGYLQVQARFVPPGMAHLFQGAVAWGPCCTLQMAPYLREGWTLDQIRIEKHSAKFHFPDNKKTAYKTYCKREAGRLKPDLPKYALRNRPFALTDAPDLDLSVSVCSFSQVQFYRDCIAPITSERDHFVNQARRVGIEFPHAFCLHMVIVTADSRLLLAKRSDKLRYNPGVWSLSVEEQMSEEDLREPPDRVMRAWAHRLLWEELGLSREDINETDVRVLSVFLEADVLNCSMAAVAYLPLSSKDLEALLRAGGRPDPEVDEFLFISEDQLLDELRDPTRPYHTTAQYRMLLFLASRNSFPAVVRNIAYAGEKKFFT